MKMALLFISHNLAVMARLCNRIGVMYAGSVVEFADKKSLFGNPLHPYTIGLLRAVPRPERREEPLKAIPGNVCNLLEPPPGCRFHPRCFKAKEICRAKPPPLEIRPDDHGVACYFPGE
jgi:oligopeptide/dipeptide ABC transporter ATP-binding protein